MTPARLLVNPASGSSWLAFAKAPSEEVRVALRAGGWRWGREAGAWRHDGLAASVPGGVAFQAAGVCDYRLAGVDRADHVVRTEYEAEVREILCRARAVAGL